MAARSTEVEGRPFAIYCRLSRKKPVKPGVRPGRDTETVERQEQECREYAAANGLPIADHLVFVDNHYSAWKRKGAIRPAWLEMMAAVERGELAGILVYKLDRFTRTPGDMETLIELAERRGLMIRGPLAGHIDLDTANGRREARGAANQAASESDNTSERTRDALAEIMLDGKPMGGGRCFGFEVGGQVQRPDEVAVLRDVAARLLAGEPLQKLAADMNAKGLRTVRGGEWGGANLGRLLGAHRYGGWVEHHGDLVARMPGEPVWDAATYDAVQALLTSRRRGARPTGRFLLTGLLTCATCQRNMNGATRHKGLADGSKPRIYRCPKQAGGCGLSILAEPVEQIVGEHMVGLLADPDTVAATVAKDQHLHEARAVIETKLEAVQQRRDELEVKFNNFEVSEAAYEKSRATLNGQIEKLLAGRGEVSTATAVDAYDADADWLWMNPEQKRAAIRHYRVRIEVLPMQSGTRRFDPDRVTFPPR